MSTEANKLIFTRFHREVLLGENYDVIDEIVAPDVVSHNPIPGQAPGADGLKQALKGFRKAFPDLRSTAEDMIAEGDKVACRFKAQGTHRGEFLGFKPTGQSFTYEEMVFARIVNGKIVEHWAVADVMDMMLKMGAIQYNG